MPTIDPSLRELGTFLRTRREKVTPAEVGLQVSGRRRTPGLRREEVATLAGVGVTWYTWLEQGRARGVSDQVIDAVARTLKMTEVERQHALVLAGHAAPKPVPPMTVLPAHTAILEQLLPLPAAIQTHAYEIVAANRTYRYLYNDLDEYEPEDRNCAWLMFMDPVWRGSLVDEDVVLSEIAARLRALKAGHQDDPRWTRLIDRLLEHSPDFRARWESHDVTDEGARVRRYRSPRAGLLTVDFQSLWLDPALDARIIVMSPVDTAGRDRLERLASLVASAPAWTAREDVLARTAS